MYASCLFKSMLTAAAQDGITRLNSTTSRTDVVGARGCRPLLDFRKDEPEPLPAAEFIDNPGRPDNLADAERVDNESGSKAS